MTSASNQTSILKLTMGLVLAGLVLYGGSVSHPFHFDDALIVADTNVSNPAQWRSFLNPLHLRQLTFFTFYLNHLVSGDRPALYHLVNVMLHIANAVLLLILLAGFLDRRIAFAAAAIFLVHPVQTEAVLYVYQRSILLGCFFSLLALLAYRSHRRWLALVLFILAFEAKESALAIPLLLGISLFIDRSERSVKPRLFAGLLLLLVALLGVGTIALLQYHGEKTVGIGAAAAMSPPSYLLTETRVIYTYLRLLFLPYSQSVEYDFAPVRSIDAVAVFRMLGLLALITGGLFLATLKNWRVTGFAVLTFFLLLAPTSSVIPSIDTAFEHRLYLPMLGFSVFAASLLLRLPRPGWLVTLILVVLSIATLNRGRVWASDRSLWEDAVRHVPTKPRAWFNLAGACLQSDPERARSAYYRTLELKPDYVEAYYNLGVIEQTKGNYAEAVKHYDRATAINKEYWPAWNNLGNSLVAMGQMERALNAFETTLRLNPDHWPSQYNIAIVDFKAGRFGSAIPRLRTVLDWRPDFRDARYLLAVSLARTGQQVEADREWQKIGNNNGQPPMPATIPAPAH